MIEAFSKYPSIHATKFIDSNSNIQLLEKYFSQFGYPNIVVSDNAHVSRISNLI